MVALGSGYDHVHADQLAPDQLAPESVEEQNCIFLSHAALQRLYGKLHAAGMAVAVGSVRSYSDWKSNR